ncbi:MULTISPECIES: molybdenum cofactor biosynthesis protein MoaE [Arthrobacter]|uniref:Molybdenum cofactor biosynthesis protein MoaE n=2 Tax=Arthrobacter TaxID=1663 RepID=A0ABU9KPD3_9MICC|nr:molybdenum cofactor biosynthesis protein MoaE [Arthrobacter sp. YJM1]MDP5227844.1 molybdenum cofactor biosynthesis protein MoaE [Arthrobacter sp. YJM1]
MTIDNESVADASAGHATVLFAELSAEAISADAALAAVSNAHAGAVVTFCGVVRDHDGGKSVDRLAYSAHPSAQAALETIVDELGASHGTAAVWVSHRVGDLAIGDAALVCAVATAHRREAFELCSAIVERVKAEVPIWKEQFFTDGTVEWVGI